MRRLLPVFVALLVLTAGCSGLLPGGSDGTPANGTDANGTDTPMDGSELKADTLAAMDAVETYRIDANVSTRYSGTLDQTVNGTSEGRFDRTAHVAYLNQTQSALGQSYVVETYYVNDTLYQRSGSYVLQYDSEWVRFPAAENATEQWAQFDTLTRQRAVLNASNATLDGTRTVNGTETYVLRAQVDRSRLGELGFAAGTIEQGGLNVTNLNATFYVDAETNRPVKSVTNLTGLTTVQAGNNQRTLRIQQRIELDFGGYGAPVTVTLPEEASNAVPIDTDASNATANGTGNATTPAR